MIGAWIGANVSVTPVSVTPDVGVPQVTTLHESPVWSLQVGDVREGNDVSIRSHSENGMAIAVGKALKHAGAVGGFSWFVGNRTPDQEGRTILERIIPESADGDVAYVEGIVDNDTACGFFDEGLSDGDLT